MPKEMKVFTRDEVAKHNHEKSAYIIIDSNVYDITRFAGLHPGGELELMRYAGKDATESFFSLHRSEVLDKFGPRLLIGTIKGEEAELTQRAPGEISTVPYSEPGFWRNLKSPYMTDSHLEFRKVIRKFLEEEILPEGREAELEGTVPTKEVYKKMGDFNLMAARLGPGPHLKGRKLPGGIKPEEYDYFHEMITHDEIARLGLPSYQDGLGAGFYIGASPVINFGTKKMQDTVVKQVLDGTKRICLAISEPYAGSDVADIQCTAVKTPDGKNYIVNGAKKWITNGTFSDYFVTAVRTGSAGMGGVSLLLIERSKGVQTKPIKTMYGSCAGTSYITFENVVVPVENLLGEENQGFQCIMANFNHERWMIVSLILSGCRSCIEECFKWSFQRKVFGKRLIDQPVVREKLAYMAADAESLQSWMENLTYQMTQMEYMEQMVVLPSAISLIKLKASRFQHFVADCAAQIFGGRAITKTGQGMYVERFIRSVKYGSILGGSEEIMADLGIRMAMKEYPRAARL